ncbi:putative phosphoinositide phospholipase C [Helianthus anomalus]
MTAPLQHYFIYTGHNSYLTGNQLIGGCSVKQIIKSLKKGVRVIELDLWPTSSKEGIHVLHGGTMTTPVALRTCFESIKEHAFVKSPYPVIITLEDHLTPNLRDIVAKMVTEIFGDKLYRPEAGDHNEFPSPEALKHRILLSTKLPKEHLDRINSNQDDNMSYLNHDLSQIPEIDFEEENEDAANENSGETAPPYVDIIGIPATKANKKLKKALTVESGKANRLSLSEQTLERAASLYGADLVRFTQKNILRVYPKGTRVTSTNFKPLRAWMHGVQMVAFNMQGYGRSLWMMHGMFRSNGKCGYVKKPDFLMSMGPNNEVFEPKVPLSVKKTLKVTHPNTPLVSSHETLGKSNKGTRHGWSLWFIRILEVVPSFSKVHGWFLWFARFNTFSPAETFRCVGGGLNTLQSANHRDHPCTFRKLGTKSKI